MSSYYLLEIFIVEFMRSYLIKYMMWHKQQILRGGFGTTSGPA